MTTAFSVGAAGPADVPEVPDDVPLEPDDPPDDPVVPEVPPLEVPPEDDDVVSVELHAAVKNATTNPAR